MAVIMKVNGKIITWKVMVYISGTMVESMRVNIKMIKSMALVFIHGQMDVVMKDIGGKANSTVLEHILFLRTKK